MNFTQMDSFEKFQVSDARNIVGGDKQSKSIGGAHKGQSDSVASDGTVTWEDGSTGKIQ